jgi:3-methylfumaryl-CoA hydratase
MVAAWTHGAGGDIEDTMDLSRPEAEDMTIDIDHVRSWIGRAEVAEDVITPVPVAALAATLDRNDPKPRPGDELPPLWHWLYFLPVARQSELGPDGHPKRGGFLPPVSLPRRMWAGARFEFHQPLRIGEPIIRKSTIADVSMKEGRSGPLIFVLVRHEIAGPAGLALVEEHDIVYRTEPCPDDKGQPPRPAAPMGAVWRREINADGVMLFRYSALIFVAHRIHYDRGYATEVEGYPGLVVHGPLIATLLADLLRRNSSAALKSFRFRAVSPLFDASPFSVCGTPDPDGRASLWAQSADGHLAMKAEAVMQST